MRVAANEHAELTTQWVCGDSTHSSVTNQQVDITRYTVSHTA